MQHVMIDLETLGTKSNSVVLSIAAIQFDLNSGETGAEFKVNISLQDCINSGFEIQATTLHWWLTQKHEIMLKMFETSRGVIDALNCFSTFFKSNNLVYPWGNSARFDLQLLENVYDKLNVPIPWNFRNERCYRTIVNMVPKIQIEKPIDAHDPLIDCKYQITKLFEVFKILKKGIVADSIIF